MERSQYFRLLSILLFHEHPPGHLREHVLSAIRLMDPILLPLLLGRRRRRYGGEQLSGKCQIRIAVSDDNLFLLNRDVGIVIEDG